MSLSRPDAPCFVVLAMQRLHAWLWSSGSWLHLPAPRWGACGCLLSHSLAVSLNTLPPGMASSAPHTPSQWLARPHSCPLPVAGSAPHAPSRCPGLVPQTEQCVWSL